jgi:hypothetical protein
MQKEVTVTGLIQNCLSVPAPRILFADDSKRLLALNFILMSKLDGSILGQLEKTLAPEQIKDAYAQIGQLLRAISVRRASGLRIRPITIT